MKRIAIVVSVAVLILGVAILAQQKTTSAASILSFTPESPEQELRRLENEWAEAWVKSDVAFFEQIMSDDYTWTDPEGNVYTKAQDIASLKSGEFVVTPCVHHEMKVRVYGDAAVVTGRTTVKGTYKGKDFIDDVRWTDTWVKSSGRWQCIAGHSSEIAQK